MSSVLIVGENPEALGPFRSNLQRAGFQVHEVESGPDSLSRLEELRPDAVILDIHAPDAEALSVCRRLRDDPRWLGLPVLMLTAREDDATQLAGLRAGVDDCVSWDVARGSGSVEIEPAGRVSADGPSGGAE